MEDNEIIELYWSRSEEAIQETDKKYQKLCNYIADNILHSKEDVEECVQDTYYTVWNRIPEERPTFFRAFICKITRNIAMNMLDYKMAKKRTTDKTILLEGIEELYSITPNLLENIELEELTNAINRFLNKLTQKKRIILVRRYFFMDSLEEIAQYSGMNINTVKSVLRRENQKLRLYLIKGGYGK